MSIFSKLFGKATPPPFEMTPTAVMMDENKYWALIDDSIAASAGEQYVQMDSLVRALEKLEPSEIVGFRLRTDKLLFDTYNSETWCAGYIMNGGCSDDGFEYFRLWVISQGRQVYENAKADPDSLADVVGQEVEEYYDFEGLWYVANDAFKNKTGKDLYDYIDNAGFKFGEGDHIDFEFTWQEEDPESRRKICPRLFERFETKEE